ncbi:MAG: PIN domain-containing protein [Phycisphaerales bacterium]|nr:PIN domain-containing protein [Phycisphaerales bacterium]
MPATTATQLLAAACQPSAEGLPRIGLDTNCVQYYISNPPVQPWADCLDPIFQAGVAGQVELYVSTVVVSELLAHVHFAHRNNTGYDPELDLMAIMNRHFRILEVDGAVASAAGRLRGNYAPGDKLTLKTPDALIGATSLNHNHTLFVTNDAQLADALPPGACVYLRDVALEWLAEQFPSPCLADPEPVQMKSRGPGLPGNPTPASLELGSIQPAPTAKWDRILADALNVAAAINEPCIFFVLTAKNGRRWETTEVLFWNAGMNERRPWRKILRRLVEHLGYSRQTGSAANKKHRVHAFVASSLARARQRQTQASFNSKTDHQREADAWCEYLGPFRLFREVLSLPQTTCLLCEDGVPRALAGAHTADFVRHACTVLGWGAEQ